ncbi:MAG: CpaF family protein [Lachnospira sp.]|nr:CpaF family protein [Lachnospira sp.]
MNDEFLELKEEIYSRLDIGTEISDEQLYAVVDECIFEKSRSRVIAISKREKLRARLFNAIKKLDILQELLEDDDITEIMINGCNDIFVEKNGRITRCDIVFESRERLTEVAQKIAAMSNRIVNEARPIVDTRLEDGSRVNIVLPPAAIDGPVITIRKFYDEPLTIEKLISINSISKEAAEFLKKAVEAKYNIFISGGTGSGKTTFLNALSNFIPKDERVITIEDSAELQIKGVNNLVRLEARNANAQGENEITIRDLIKSSLRMRPDRIIVGEVRGAEAIDMLQAMNTGHDGSLSTGHSNSTADMLSRLETMVLMGMQLPLDAIRKQIGSAIDIIVQLGRLRDKTRKVLEITEVYTDENGLVRLSQLYKFCEAEESKDGKVRGFLKKQNCELYNQSKMYNAGIKEW